MLNLLDIYDEDLPDCKETLLEQWKGSQGMIRSALRVGLAVGTVVGVVSIGIASAYTSFKERVEY